MTKQHQAYMLLLVAMLICAVTRLPVRGNNTNGSGGSSDDGFNTIVKLMETQFHTKRKRSRLMGLAKLGVRIARPRDVRNFKLAIFEEADFSTSDFGTPLRAALKAEWRPLAQVRAREGAEQTYTYLKEDGKNFKILIVNIEPREATVLEVEIPPERLFEWLQNPQKESQSLTDESGDESK
ncbi:MAG: hypothetical protein H0V88_11570 [Pyrinomonadaceae bacterium]|nr:hypothetical protein [Pyrinomonadaceae bacterium]